MPDNGDWKPCLAIVLVGMVARWRREGRCLVIIAGRDGVLCLIVTVVYGKGSGERTG